MRAWMLTLSALLACAAAVAQEAPGENADDVVIYRCTDADGSLTLRDTPCDDAQTQQTRTMLRPQDAPARAPAPGPESAPAPAEPQVVVVSPPQPMYECVTPEGDRYTSDTGDGNPRWVPLWTLGYPVGHGGDHHPARPSAERGVTFVDDRTRMPPPANISIPPAYDRPQPSPGILHGRLDRPRPHPPGYGHGYGGGGTWIRDECTRLPQGDVCDRLRDRRQEIRRRFFNAQESERNTLRQEERALSARLANDCGIR
ncbi:DUF4124 domain-containing protein [Luteimonas salinilitoris]|uniref:DUF4124 domain-containing protein n=1 Tax=Luteimonas salinilitoris TaxID=3237697 RepID=A0ABV4HSV4_9GAMM